MPLILPSTGLSAERLRELAVDHRTEAEQAAAMFARLPTAPPNPYAVADAVELLRSSAELADALLAVPGLPPEVLIRLTNQLYSARNVLPMVLKFAEQAPPAFPSRKPPAGPSGSKSPATEPRR